MDLRYYWFIETELDGIPLIVSRTGWSSELGYEIYLRDSNYGDALWERIMAVGMPMGLKPGHTSTIRRIEGGMLSYHADADIHTNPFELGMDRLVNVDMEAEFIGKFALQRIRDNGVSRKQVGLIIDGEPMTGPNTRSGRSAMTANRGQGDLGGLLAAPAKEHRAGHGGGRSGRLGTELEHHDV